MKTQDSGEDDRCYKAMWNVTKDNKLWCVAIYDNWVFCFWALHEGLISTPYACSLSVKGLNGTPNGKFLSKKGLTSAPQANFNSLTCLRFCCQLPLVHLKSWERVNSNAEGTWNSFSKAWWGCSLKSGCWGRRRLVDGANSSCRIPFKVLKVWSWNLFPNSHNQQKSTFYLDLASENRSLWRIGAKLWKFI